MPGPGFFTLINNKAAAGHIFRFFLHLSSKLYGVIALMYAVFIVGCLEIIKIAVNRSELLMFGYTLFYPLLYYYITAV